MTRLLTTGYETGDLAEAGASTIGSLATLTVVSATPTARSGTYCLKVSNTGVAQATTHKKFTLAAAKTDVWVRFGMFVHPSGTTSELMFAGFQDASANPQNCVTYDCATGTIRARQGAGVIGTLLGTSSATMTADAWHLIELRCQISSTTSGVTEVWLDGARVINFAGDNTAGATAANVQALLLGQGSGSPTTVAGFYMAYDDIALNDTAGSINNGQIFDGKVLLLKPNGAGSTTGQTRGGTDTGANYSQVNELPPSLTQYVFSATAATRDTYALEDVPAGSWAVNCCEVLAYGQNSDASAGSLGLTVKSGATTNEGTAQSLVTTAQYLRQLYETDPNTSAAWTVSAVNALEAGTTVR